MTLLAVVIVIYVTIKYRTGALNENPGEDYVDPNIPKTGKTKTLGSYSSSGFIGWETYFNLKIIKK